MIEETVSFEVLKHRQYLLFIYYEGELSRDPNTGHHLCEYYSLMLSYNSLQRLLSELACLPSGTKKLTPLEDFGREPIRGEVTQHGYLEVRGGSEIRKKVAIEIERGLFDIHARLRFDHPFLLPELGLFTLVK